MAEAERCEQLLCRKRTRSNVKQSKYGCFTCKARRIKCDERKPICRRCQCSGRVCGGYPSGMPPETTLAQPGTIDYFFDYARNSGMSSIVSQPSPRNHEHNRYVELGCNVLAQAPYRAQILSESSLWTQALPQFSMAVPTLAAAVAAFGASYQSSVLDHNDSASRRAALKQYVHALQMLKQEPESQKHVPLPLALACIVLACAELLHHRPREALTHLRGAFAMMSIHENWNLPAADLDVSLSTDGQDTQWILDREDEISLLFVKLDLQKATYGGVPDLSLASADSIGNQVGDFKNVQEADHALCKILNSCYRFIASAGKFKYRPAYTVPPWFRIEQGRHIANLRTWLSSLDRLVRQSGCKWRQIQSGSNGSYFHALVLRSQGLIAFVEASTVLDPYEKAYDRHTSQFQQIIESAEEVLEIDQKKRDDGSNLPPFTPEMGIIHPLFVTAEKYRDSVWRRRAIQLLQRAHREGPWVGKIEAAVAQTCLYFEEKNAGRQENSPHILPEHIDEQDRLSGCSKDQMEQCPDSTLWVQVRLYKRRDVTVLSGNDIENENHWRTWQQFIRIPKQENRNEKDLDQPILF